MTDSTAHLVVLLLGSNLGNREEHLWNARRQLENQYVNLLHGSRIYESEPWGVTGQPDYLNQALTARTVLHPQELLHHCKAVEIGEGRTQRGKYLSRTLDIDVLFFDEAVYESNDLIIPHPRLHLRKFALIPLAELVPDLMHPVLGKPVRILLEECVDSGRVSLYKSND